MSGLLLHPVPFAEASAFLADKPLVSREVFDSLEPELKAYAFTITGVESFDALQRCRDVIAGIPMGRDWDQMKDEIEAEISPFLIDPSASHAEQLVQAKAAQARAALLMRLHGFNAYEVAHDGVMEEMKDIFTHFEWQTMGDKRVRPEHRAMNGIILPSNSKFWTTIWPRRGWGCRCQKVGITGLEAEERIAAEKHLAPEKRMIMTGSALTQLEGGILNRGADRQFNLGAEDGPARAFGSMRPPLAELKTRYDADLWTAFLDRMGKLEVSKGSTVKDWLEGKDVRTPPPAVVAVSGQRTAEDVDASMKALLSQWQDNHDLRGDITSRTAELAKRLRVAISARDAEKINGLRTELRDLRKEEKAAIKTRRDLWESARDAVAVPADQRGRVRWPVTMQPDKGIKLLQDKGSELASRYIHADYLPAIDMQWHPNAKATRSQFAGGTVYMTHDLDRAEEHWNDRISTVMHEITHGVELQTPPAYRAARGYLTKRANGEAPKKLSVLTGNEEYRDDEVAIEDEWRKRGGRAYTGKVMATGTEILTMGVERLHRDPLGFYSADPDHFWMVVKTLQKL